MELKKKGLLLQTESSASEETAIFTNNYHAFTHCTHTAAELQSRDTYGMPEGTGQCWTQPEGTCSPVLEDKEQSPNREKEERTAHID